MTRQKNVLSEENTCLFPSHLANLMTDYIYFGKQLAVFGVIRDVDVFQNFFHRVVREESCFYLSTFMVENFLNAYFQALSRAAQ
jgi:hypothetical protein